jgi:hypothetical protein
MDFNIIVNGDLFSGLHPTGREGFYLTLLSDGSMEAFPNNTVAQFKTLLPHPLNLTDGDWEVALTEMMYSVDLKNISTHEAYFDVFLPDGPVKIRVRIGPPHPLVCCKRRLNGAVLRMRPENPRSRVTAGVAR